MMNGLRLPRRGGGGGVAIFDLLLVIDVDNACYLDFDR